MSKYIFLQPRVVTTGDTVGYMNVIATDKNGYVDIINTGSTINTLSPDKNIVIGDVITRPGDYKQIPGDLHVDGDIIIASAGDITIGAEIIKHEAYMTVDGYVNCTGTIDIQGTFFTGYSKGSSGSNGSTGTSGTSGSSGGYDINAQTFLTATSITDTTIGDAINSLVVGLKTNGIWEKLIVLYPMVGGLADTHKYNLIDTTTHMIDFYGGWSHDANGITGNGVSAYANTNFNPFTTLTVEYSFSLGYYGSVANPGGVDMGVQNLERSKTGLFGGNILNANIYIHDCWNEGSGRLLSGSSNGGGFWVGSRINDSDQAVYDNGELIGLNSNTVSVEPPSENYYLGASNYAGVNPEYFSSQNFRLAFFGNGLTPTDVLNFNSLVTTFEIALSRNVA